jgi:hypothetical protein
MRYAFALFVSVMAVLCSVFHVEPASAMTPADAISEAKSAWKKYLDHLPGFWGIAHSESTGSATWTTTKTDIKVDEWGFDGDSSSYWKTISHQTQRIKKYVFRYTASGSNPDYGFRLIKSPSDAWLIKSVRPGPPTKDELGYNRYPGFSRCVSVDSTCLVPLVEIPEFHPKAITEPDAEGKRTLTYTLDSTPATVSIAIGDGSITFDSEWMVVAAKVKGYCDPPGVFRCIMEVKQTIDRSILGVPVVVRLETSGDPTYRLDGKPSHESRIWTCEYHPLDNEHAAFFRTTGYGLPEPLEPKTLRMYAISSIALIACIIVGLWLFSKWRGAGER